MFLLLVYEFPLVLFSGRIAVLVREQRSDGAADKFDPHVLQPISIGSPSLYPFHSYQIRVIFACEHKLYFQNLEPVLLVFEGLRAYKGLNYLFDVGLKN